MPDGRGLGLEVSGWDSRCLRCGEHFPLEEHSAGCARCARDGVGVPVVPTATGYRAVSDSARPGGARSGTMWDYAGLLPVDSARSVSLGEGNTPLVELSSYITGEGGSGRRVLLKDERANPTGSFKDRLYSVAASRAREVGARDVALASSGNAGLSAAAYSAAAGLSCTVLSTSDPREPTAAGLSAVEANLLITETSADRWRALTTGVRELGWYPLTNYRTPPVSSNVFGLHGYRTIAYEIAEGLGWSCPDWIVVPVARGDALYGIWAGFAEMRHLGWIDREPELVAVERFPSLTDALDHDREQPVEVDVPPNESSAGASARSDSAGDDTAGRVEAHSIYSQQGTYMAVRALRESGGFAVASGDDALWRAWRRFARRGLLVELSSAAVLVGLDALRERGRLRESATVVLLGTGNPFTQATLPSPGSGSPLADPSDAAELARALG